MSFKLFLLITCISFSFATQGIGQGEERSYTLIEREIAYLENIWPGSYDNVEQLDFDKFYGKEDAHRRVHSNVKFISNLAGTSTSGFLVDTYQNNDPADGFGKFLYVVKPDDKNKRIIGERYQVTGEVDFSDKGLWEAEGVKKICDIMFVREGMGFDGRMVDRTCDGNDASDIEIRIQEGLFSFRYITVPIDLKKQKSIYRLSKARDFVCMIDFPREEGGRPVKTEHYIDIQDQGGEFEFEYMDGRKMVFGMRNTWSFGMQRETFVIFITEGDSKGKTLIYSWGAPGADRIGFNPGWIRAQCDIDTPENRAYQKKLRSDS